MSTTCKFDSITCTIPINAIKDAFILKNVREKEKQLEDIVDITLLTKVVQTSGSVNLDKIYILPISKAKDDVAKKLRQTKIQKY